LTRYGAVRNDGVAEKGMDARVKPAHDDGMIWRTRAPDAAQHIVVRR
jgi:hypothetical protein